MVMLRWGVSILVAGALLGWILSASGGLGSCGPGSGMLPVLIGFMIALPLGALLTLIGLIQLAVHRIRHRSRDQVTLRITPQ
jgi:hypothetical protein